MALQVRKCNYRGDDGFSVMGTDRDGRRINIWTWTQVAARAIQAAYKYEGATPEVRRTIVSAVLMADTHGRHEA